MTRLSAHPRFSPVMLASDSAQRMVSLGLSLLLLGCASSPVVSSTPTPPSPIQPVADVNTQSLGMGQMLPVSAQATLGDQVVQLEVAATPEQQAMGLMYRPALPDDRGMLFPFEIARPVHFWMRNVPVALDMVFMYNGEIKAIASSVPPCTTPSCPTYGPADAVNQVIELRAGRADELGLAVGDQVEIEYLQPPVDAP